MKNRNQMKDILFAKKSIVVRPGKVEDYSAYGKVGVKDAQGHIICKKSISNIQAAFSPSVNKALEPTALLRTSYEDATKGGKVKPVDFSTTLSSLKFMVWDPYIDAYTLQMNGTACGKPMSFHFDVKVDRSTVSFQAQHSKFPNPVIDYSLPQNLAGDIATNSLTNLPGTTISYLVNQPASYAADYGFLQVAVGSTSVQGSRVAAVEANDLQEEIMILGEAETPVVACRTPSSTANEDISVTILQPIRVEAGASKEISFTSSPNLFTAPYFSPTCTAHDIVRASQYYSSVDFITYLVQKPVVASGETSHWVPVKKVDWSAEFGTSCPHDYCGLGLGAGKTPFVNAWQLTGTNTAQPKLDANWVLKPTLPTWTNTVKGATTSSLFKVTDGREGEYHTNFFVFCPKTGNTTEETHYDYLDYSEFFESTQIQDLVSDIV